MIKTDMIVLMEQFVIYLSLSLFGLILGSFAGASVWRLRARQLVEDKAAGEEVDSNEYKTLKKLTKASVSNDRSQCLHCSYTLKWYDLIPLISWLSLGGRCRKCRQPIGYMEPLIEVGVALLFVLSYAYWPYPLSSSIDIARFVVWLVAGVALAILFVYDSKWFLLPNNINFTVIGLGAINSLLIIINTNDKLNAVINIVASVIILSGIYLSLYLISKGRWIGFGDIKLGLGLALLIADWKLAFLALFAANLIGCIIVVPTMFMGKLKLDSRVPFGPLLIAGLFVAVLAGSHLLSIYANYLP